MRVVRVVCAITICVLVRLCSYAASGTVYPGASSMYFSWSVVADTVTVTIRAGAAPAVTGLYLTENTVYTPKLLRCLVDGASRSSIPVETGSLYSGIRTTRWFIGNFQTEVKLQYYVAGYANSHMHWVANHAGPAFGVAFDPRCCVDYRGNVDNDPADLVDVSDLASLVAILLGEPLKVQCPEEANVNGDSAGLLDVGDVSALIEYLTNPAGVPAACPVR